MISIIIVNFKSEEFLEKCLKSIQKFPPKCSYEIIIVDNNSGTDPNKFGKISRNYISEKNFKFIKSAKNLGYGQGNNLGVKKSKGDFIVILNPDIEIKKGTLDILLKFLQKNSTVGIVGPKLLYPDGKVQDSFRRFPNPPDLIIKRIGFLRKLFHKRMVNFLMWDNDFEKEIEVDWVVGAFMMIRKNAWNKVGGFDPRFFLFFEDTDLCKKMWQKGFKVYFNPHCEALHNHDRLSETSSLKDFFMKKTFRMHIISAAKYFFKWRSLVRKVNRHKN